MEPIFRMLLPGLDVSSGRQARVMRSRPSTLVCTMNSQSSSLPSATVSRPLAPPALLMSTSSLPVKPRDHFTNSFTLAVEATSSECAWAAGAPVLRHSVATCWRRSMRRAPSSKLAPSRANARAAAAPKPLEAPVIKTHLAVRGDGITGRDLAAQRRRKATLFWACFGCIGCIQALRWRAHLVVGVVALRPLRPRRAGVPGHYRSLVDEACAPLCAARRLAARRLAARAVPACRPFHL